MTLLIKIENLENLLKVQISIYASASYRLEFISYQVFLCVVSQSFSDAFIIVLHQRFLLQALILNV